MVKLSEEGVEILGLEELSREERRLLLEELRKVLEVEEYEEEAAHEF